MITTMEWRVCPGFSRYEVSDCGDVRLRFKSKTRRAGWRPRGGMGCDGYHGYKLVGDDGEKQGISTHTLVALTFIGPPPTDKHEIAHNNGSRLCNCVWNLRWATRAENHKDLKLHGTSISGPRNGRARELSETDISTIKEMRDSNLSYHAIRKIYHISHRRLLQICEGKEG